MPKGSKKKKKSAGSSWCWYCDREFEDAKVLLQHQKAKHFRCPHCPRRLNTAGGLAVHIDQVHKLGTDKIENALPGRESFDIEIYGMEGIPANDLAAWKKRKAEESGETVQENRAKKPKYPTRPLTAEEIRVQLAAHRLLMSDKPKPLMGVVPPPGFVPPPPGMPLPPPGVLPLGIPPPPGFIPPPPGMSLPPPPGMPLAFAPPPFALPPGIPPPPPGVNIAALLPPGVMPPPPGSMPFPPPGFPAGMPPPPAGLGGMPPPMATSQPLAAAGSAGAAPTGPAALRGQPPAAVVETVASSAVTLKPGTLLVYGDNEVSPEEKRAKLAQYKVDDASAESVAAGDSTGGANGTRTRAKAEDFLQ